MMRNDPAGVPGRGATRIPQNVSPVAFSCTTVPISPERNVHGVLETVSSFDGISMRPVLSPSNGTLDPILPDPENENKLSTLLVNGG